MKFCFACGEEIPRQANFCPECGADLSVLQDGSDDGGTEDGETTNERESSGEGENRDQSAVDTGTESTPSGDVETESEPVAEPETGSRVDEPTETETGEEPETPTEPETGEEPETPTEPEPGEEPETPTEPEPGEEPETPTDPEPGEEPETPTETESGEEPVATDATAADSTPDTDTELTGDEATDSTGDSDTVDAVESTSETPSAGETDDGEATSSGPTFVYDDSSSASDGTTSSDEGGTSSSDLEDTPSEEASEEEPNGERLDATESTARESKEPTGDGVSDGRPQWVVEEEANSGEDEFAGADDGRHAEERNPSEDTNRGADSDVVKSEQGGQSPDGDGTQPMGMEPQQPARSDEAPESSEQTRASGPADDVDPVPSQPHQETPTGVRETSSEPTDSGERRRRQGPTEPSESTTEPQSEERPTPRFARPGEEPSASRQSTGRAQGTTDTPPQSTGATPSSSETTASETGGEDERHPAVTGAIVGIGAFGVSYLATYLALIIDFLALSDVETSIGDLVPTSGVSVPGSEYGLNAPIEMSVWEFALWMLYGGLDIGLGVDSSESVQEMPSSIDPFAAVDAFLTTSLYTVAVLLVLAAAGVVTVLLVSKEHDAPLEVVDGAIAGGAVAVGFGAVAVASTFVVGFGGEGLSVQPGLEATAINAVLFGAVAGGIGGAAGSYLFTADEGSNEGTVASTQQPAQPTQTRPPERGGRSEDQRAQSPEHEHPSSAQVGPQREQMSAADETDEETQSQRERSPPRFEKPKSGE
ncbi:hypothetical protein ACLI4U_09900 [Natrialbaceae archaeon A-CW2]